MNITTKEITDLMAELNIEQELLGECYRTLGALVQERDSLLRGEFICKKCGLRKDGEPVDCEF